MWKDDERAVTLAVSCMDKQRLVLQIGFEQSVTKTGDNNLHFNDRWTINYVYDILDEQSWAHV